MKIRQLFGMHVHDFEIVMSEHWWSNKITKTGDFTKVWYKCKKCPKVIIKDYDSHWSKTNLDKVFPTP